MYTKDFWEWWMAYINDLYNVSAVEPETDSEEANYVPYEEITD